MLRGYLWICLILLHWLIGCIGLATTFACKSQECLWQDWYIYTRIYVTRVFTGETDSYHSSNVRVIKVSRFIGLNRLLSSSHCPGNESQSHPINLLLRKSSCNSLQRKIDIQKMWETKWYIVTCQAHPVLVKKANQMCGSFLFKIFMSRSGPLVDGPKGGLLETPPRWHATIFYIYKFIILSKYYHLHDECVFHLFVYNIIIISSYTPRGSSWLFGPIPDNISSFGVSRAPAEMITSLLASTLQIVPLCLYSTPTALVPSNKICNHIK